MRQHRPREKRGKRTEREQAPAEKVVIVVDEVEQYFERMAKRGQQLTEERARQCKSIRT